MFIRHFYLLRRREVGINCGAIYSIPLKAV